MAVEFSAAITPLFSVTNTQETPECIYMCVGYTYVYVCECDCLHGLLLYCSRKMERIFIFPASRIFFFYWNLRISPNY